MEYRHIPMEMKLGRLERQRERDWKPLKCGAIEESKRLNGRIELTEEVIEKNWE